MIVPNRWAHPDFPIDMEALVNDCFLPFTHIGILLAHAKRKSMTTISNEFAAELIAAMRAKVEARDETMALEPPDPIPLLILKLWDDLQQMRAATSFLNGGIKAPTRVAG